MEAFLVSILVVGLAEIGDKTQILSMILAARFQRPVPILFGILLATIANHAAAGFAGELFGSLVAGPWLRWILGVSFLSVAIWALFPTSTKVTKRRSPAQGPSPRPSSPSFSPRLATNPDCDGRARGPFRGLLSRRHRHHARNDAPQHSGGCS